MFNGIQGVVNPPITFYGDDSVMGYDEDQFMKTMRILTTSYNEPQQFDQMKSNHPVSLEKPRASNTVKKQRSNSISSSNTAKKSSAVNKKELRPIESEDEDEDIYDNDDKKQPTLTKEDKRRRNTAASARFRVKKKLREQALQQTANEMTERAKAFEEHLGGVDEEERERFNEGDWYVNYDSEHPVPMIEEIPPEYIDPKTE